MRTHVFAATALIVSLAASPAMAGGIQVYSWGYSTAPMYAAPVFYQPPMLVHPPQWHAAYVPPCPKRRGRHHARYHWQQHYAWDDHRREDWHYRHGYWR